MEQTVRNLLWGEDSPLPSMAAPVVPLWRVVIEGRVIKSGGHKILWRRAYIAPGIDEKQAQECVPRLAGDSVTRVERIKGVYLERAIREEVDSGGGQEAAFEG
jgi:hypothetical protein